MDNLTEVQAATLQRFLEAWKKWDAQEWMATFADDFTQVTLPFSLGIPNRTRAQVEEILPALMAIVKSYELTIHHVIHDAEKNKAAVYASSKGILPWGLWEVEYSTYITFSEAGDKVSVLEEMIDPTFMRDFGPKFKQYLQDNGGPVAVAATG
ncbi:hypothetical protein BGW36DRAFT_425822 [Talaromyces proteolyticus]|uniref:SnoaL-like domain-containing protein n=1 Tax=Talaromyces proteolyticus TaxID=1131652 RepID=A0AAD4KXJ0_9EURO|nr:uncharacterized protein BGW36DRAFT_425822 [Talaromyces proteolyticus]KAH8701027.1 hypothetical protein BGW36DRAFT_425822 [Talaromyces proteolyticus]